MLPEHTKKVPLTQLDMTEKATPTYGCFCSYLCCDEVDYLRLSNGASKL